MTSTDRQKKLMKETRTCVGCGATVPSGRGSKVQYLTESGHPVLSISCVVWRRKVLRSTRNVNVCEECLVQTLVMGGRCKVAGKVFAAIRERLSATYNSMRADDRG